MQLPDVPNVKDINKLMLGRDEKIEDEIYNLKKENKFLNKIINTFEKMVNKFIKWIVKKFDITEEDNLIRDFEKGTNTFIDPEK